MLVFVLTAIAEILIGLMVYELLDPHKGKKVNWLMRWDWLIDFEAKIFNLNKEQDAIKRANKVVFTFCILSALVTLIDGVLHVFFDVPDVKEVLVVLTVLTIFPLRYLYILKRG